MKEKFTIFFLFSQLFLMQLKAQERKTILPADRISLILVQVQNARTKEPIIGASVKLKSGKGTITNVQGQVVLEAEEAVGIFTVSFIGYKKEEVSIKRNVRDYLVELEPIENKLNEVTINSGIVLRKKESFTGATATITGEQLKKIGNMNIIESIKSLDPSIVIPENIKFGANPNRMAQIEVRGKTSLSTNNLADQFSQDPNQPLFILDGFQTSLRTITDLDMNRIASISILKDAASTSLYGAQAANGVIVVETIKPKPGVLRVNYNGDFRIEKYDLSSYNMMNASEKLEFERLSGIYSSKYGVVSNKYTLDSLYNARLKNVIAGINTNWMEQPLRIGFTHKHSLYVNGGSEEFQYGLGTNYQKIMGIMKESSRDVWGANIDLTYRKGNLNISNKLMLNGYTAKNSPYGSFEQYVQLNPYYKMDWTGNPPRYLENSILENGGNNFLYQVSNPFYNASLNSYNVDENFAVQNNLALNWDITSDLRFTTSLQLGKSTRTITTFTSPENTIFDGTSVYEKGTYSNMPTNLFNYSLNGMLSYNRVFAQRHVVTANFRGELQNEKNTFLETKIVGFPAGTEGVPSFGYSFKPNTAPFYRMSIVRRASLLATINYSYDNRYFTDATYRIDGSTAFGSAKRFSPFWALGLGWNLNRESFLKNVSWLDMLRVRGNIGTSGNQNLGSFQSATVYAFDPNINYFGQGVNISALGNPNLEWQKTQSISIGTDFSAFKNRLSVTINAYRKATDPLVTSLPLPSSNGLTNFPVNIGNLLTKGLEVNVQYIPIQNLEKNIYLTIGVSGSMYSSKFDGLNKVTGTLNKVQLDNNQLQRFSDGYSPDDIWAVPSLGINSANGKEVFLKKNLEYTYEYDAGDIVRVGNLRPFSEGTIYSSLRYSGFSFNMSLRYRLGADLFNTALYAKVENISTSQMENNQDRRALYDRWKVPGDLTQFIEIGNFISTPMSSRFVQKEYLLSGESISTGYEFQKGKYKWLKKAGLQSLRFTAYVNEIFRLSNIRAERGSDYPFARSISFSINSSF